MKYLLTLALLSLGVLTFYSCTKKSTSNTAVSDAIVFTVNGVTDVNANQYVDSSIIQVLGIAFTSGTQQDVTLTPSGMPAGVTVSPATISGIPSFTGAFTYSVTGTLAPGTYPITITASSANTTSKTYNFNLVIASSPYCAVELLGTNWKQSTIITPLNLEYPNDTNTAPPITLSPTNPNEIILDGVEPVLVNCSNNTLSAIGGFRDSAISFTPNKIVWATSTVSIEGSACIPPVSGMVTGTVSTTYYR